MPTVIGAIADKWNELGGPNSFLRQPVTDEMDFSEDGRVSVFEGGAIYWWPDVGAVAMGEMFVHYTGLNCFSTTGGPGSDEPYVVIGVAAPNREPVSVRTQVHEDVDGGGTRPELIELYRGPPAGITIVYQLMEHDHGNPDDYKAAMQGVAALASAGVTALIKLIPKIGPVLASAAGPVLGMLTAPIGDALGKLLGLGDDRIGNGTLVLSPKDMVLMAIAQHNSERNVGFKIASPLLVVDGGNYKVYFGGVKTP